MVVLELEEHVEFSIIVMLSKTKIADRLLRFLIQFKIS